ncbi:MAG TPA: hypothetical protein DGB97_06860 [Staphylococcus sp.]|nr:hypothetical protein [Staphylococcus sp.]
MPTIKTKKEMNLPELIEWGWKNGIEKRSFISNGGKVTANFEDMGHFITDSYISKDVTFTVEIEEEITEDTKISELAQYSVFGFKTTRNNVSINHVKDENSLAFYIMNDDLTMTLMWTKEKGMVE